MRIVDVNDMAAIREKYLIPRFAQSCHTAVIGAYFVEGHVPNEAVRELLTQRPAVDGIALPGMPAGAPGMGGLKSEAFKIYALTKGTMSLFKTI